MIFALNVPNKWPFHRVMAQIGADWTVRLQWELMPDFKEAVPWRFQPQINYDGDPEFWTNLGDPVEDIMYVERSIQGLRLRSTPPKFRIQLTALDSYISEPATCMPLKLALLAQGIFRRLLLERTFMPRPRAIILKRKTTGPVCPQCSNVINAQSLQSDCTTCYGVGIVGGYWKTSSDNFILLNEDASAASITQLGHIDPAKRKMLFVGIPNPVPGDVIVDLSSGQRYKVRGSAAASLIWEFPIVIQAELGLLSPKDVIYKFEVAE